MKTRDRCEYVIGVSDGTLAACGKAAEHWLYDPMEDAPVPLCDNHAQFTLRPVSEWGDIE